jgi:hypothetical protein
MFGVGTFRYSMHSYCEAQQNSCEYSTTTDLHGRNFVMLGGG